MSETGIRIGVPPFLNTKPLVFALNGETGSRSFKVSEHPPSELCALMLRNETDISLLPAADIFEHPDFQVLKGVCISSFGKVGSVVVFSKKPIAEIQTVAVDSGSKSSAMMLRIALEIFCGASPEYKKREYGKGFFSGVDAGLVIGNTGLALSASPPEGFLFVFDLGEVWTEKTGLPFVYAVFAVRGGFDPLDAPEALIAAKKRGLEMADEIARKGAEELNIGADTCLDYITNRIRYDLGGAEIEGMLKFGELAARLKQNPGEVTVNFYKRARTE
ncbi:menaquinone biosynthetic enzyme MqnA/MqnD family protein [Candidatus Mycalebacterium sp.]